MNDKTLIINNYTQLPLKDVMQLVAIYLSYDGKEIMKDCIIESFHSSFMFNITNNKCSVRVDIWDWEKRTQIMGNQLVNYYEKGNRNETDNN